MTDEGYKIKLCTIRFADYKTCLTINLKSTYTFKVLLSSIGICLQLSIARHNLVIEHLYTTGVPENCINRDDLDTTFLRIK